MMQYSVVLEAFATHAQYNRKAGVVWMCHRKSAPRYECAEKTLTAIPKASVRI